MNKNLIALFILLSMISYSSDNDNRNELVGSRDISEEIKGDFVSDAHTTSGMVRANEEGMVKNFNSGNELYPLLYLATFAGTEDFVNLVDS